jgi:magnesium transporter
MTEIVEQELDEIESLVFDDNGSDAQRIGKVRQAITRLKRLIGPKQLLLRDLADQIDSFTGQHMHKYYSNNVKMVNRLWEGIEESQETVEIFKDADFTTSTEQTNRILAVLTLIFTFTIPVTVLGALYGMNVLLPGGIQTGSWLFLGTYTTLICIVFASALVAFGMYIYFKKQKWF